MSSFGWEDARAPWSLRLLLFIGCLMLSGASLSAQTIYGTINGTVTDQAKGVVPGAKVMVKNLDTGLTRETLTQDNGYYQVAALPSGRYSVTVSMPGFETLVREPITVSVSVDSTIDVTIKPAGTQEVLTITGEAPLIETTQSQLTKEVDATRIMELPGRNTLNGLALLQPGTTPNNNGRPGSGFTVNGGRSRSNNFTMDGANNNDQSLSTPRQNLPPEAIQEFQIITNNFSAEYGRNAGSYVNQITRSGTNDFHGTVQWTWQGNSLNALTTSQSRTFTASRTAGFSEKEALRRARGVAVDNLGGATLGGPIKKDHTFFFTSYDRNWFRTTAVPSPTLALSPEGLANLRAVQSSFASGTLDFLTRTFPTANDPTPRGSTNIAIPNGPTVNVPFQQYNRALTGSFPYGRDFWRWLQKIDTRLSANDNLSARYLINENNDPGAPTALPGQEVGNVGRNQSLTLNEVHIFGPRTVNEFRFTYSRLRVNFPETLPPTFTITGFNGVGNANFPQFRTDNVFEYTDNITRTYNRHSVKAGINILRYQLNSFFAPDLRGTVRYPSLQSFLLDQNATFSQYAGDGYVPARTTEIGTFIQDNFRVRQNLTLNLGLRYEHAGTPFGYFSNAKPNNKNFAPRVGFAWSPQFDGGFLEKLFGKDRMVIRGGYAISYDQIFQNILLNNSRNFPRGVTVSQGGLTGRALYNPANRPAPPTPQDYIARGGNPDLLPLRLFSLNKRISQPYGQQFSLGIERQFYGDFVFKLYYVGTRGVNLVREVERNLGFYQEAIDRNPALYQNVLPFLKPTMISGKPARITDPTKGSILIGDGLAQSVYHSMQLTVEKRFSHGIQFQANYTYSAFINDSDDILGGGTNNTLPANPLNYRLDRGRSGFDQPHRFVLNYRYELPSFWSSRAVLNRVFSGWQISGITTFASGTPFTVFNAENALGILPGQIGTITDSQRVSFNPGGSTPLTRYILNRENSGVVGNAGRNIERTGKTANFDAALVKNTKTFGENQSVQFRWEVSNLFNHRNFTTIPNNTLTASPNPAQFLNLGQTNVGGRSMIFTLRYIY